MDKSQDLASLIEEVRAESAVLKAAFLSLLQTERGRIQVEFKRAFNAETERTRVKLLNSPNSDAQIAAFNKAASDWMARFTAPD